MWNSCGIAVDWTVKDTSTGLVHTCSTGDRNDRIGVLDISDGDTGVLRPGHRGVRSMQESAQVVAGTLRMQSHAGTGTTVVFTCAVIGQGLEGIAGEKEIGGR